MNYSLHLVEAMNTTHHILMYSSAFIASFPDMYHTYYNYVVLTWGLAHSVPLIMMRSWAVRTEDP